MGVASISMHVADSAPGGIIAKLQAYIEAARAAAVDGLTWGEFGELLVALLRLGISLYDDIAVLSGAEKKAAVMDAAGRLFDAVADRCVPLAVYPLWLLARPAVRSLLVSLAGGAIEQLLPLVRAK